MSITLISAEPVPNGVTLTVCTADAHAEENCPADHTETWGKITPDEDDKTFVARVRREMKLLVEDRVASPESKNGAVPKSLVDLVGKNL